MIDSKYYLHKSDKAALKALKAIPGFSKLIKAYMNIMNERQFKIISMSSFVRINENQLSKYYDMLPPICEKLGIGVPELYLELYVRPNAYTYGDSNPFIVITSGLLETIPEELIPTVLAHECGHIACHHTLYTTMGNIILNGTFSALNMLQYSSLISLPLQVAFYYWMRCSEFSADRAAAIVDGSAEKISDVCMRLAGFDKDINVVANKDEFMKQANEYREFVENSKWNKMLEFFILANESHPFTAVRALEVTEWADTEAFGKILDGTIELENELQDDESDENDIQTIDDLVQDKKKKFEFPKLIKKNSSDLEISNELSKVQEKTVVDEIREYKSLFDDGIITEEEFIEKKKQLLNI